MTLAPPQSPMPNGGAPGGDEPLDHETLGDRQLRELIERYVSLSGATLAELGPHLYELKVPAGDRQAFGNRATIRLAFSVEAVQADGEAEMAIVGGMFVEQLIDAVRGRGARFQAGRIGAAAPEGAEHPPLPIKVRRGTAGEARSSFALHCVGRLTARVVIRAGTMLEEHLVESGVFDTTTGLLMNPDVAAECERQLTSAPRGETAPEVPVSPARPAKELVQRMLADLERNLAPQLAGLTEKASRELAQEVGRIERYYESLLEDVGGRGTDVPNKESRRVFQAERDRRVAEERDRHQVRATVHPVQLTEWVVLVQRVDWPLASTAGHRGVVTAQRVLAGDRTWLLGCPTCGTPRPTELAVCRHGHTACATCARDCGVCEAAFCREHGVAACHVDGRPACEEHARTCASCLRPHCSAHEGECWDGGHPACTSCLGACATCGRMVCDRHARLSLASAPRGARRFCADCARTCEGGSNEVVGPDEVTGCASCERVVCEQHQARCAVDGKVHCSRHLRRTDRSRRLVCEQDRAACTYEPAAVFAADEVGACTTCGALACGTHAAKCVEDLALHCRAHMSELMDRHGEMACEKHRTTCHVDGAAFSLTGTKECPVCGRRSCQRHTQACVSCGRGVCASDVRTAGLCTTCSTLAVLDEPTDAMIAAANRLFGEAGKAKSWRSARDASHLIVEADLGWTRKVTFAMRHGADRAELAYSRSMLGSRKLAG